MASAPSSMPDRRAFKPLCEDGEKTQEKRVSLLKGLTATFKEKLKAMFPQGGRGRTWIWAGKAPKPGGD